MLRMGRKLQLASGFTCMDADWGHIGPCPEPLAYIQSAERSHASSIGGFEASFFSDHGDLVPTSKSSRVPATPELCERACALRREVMRGFGDHGSSAHSLARCRHSNQTLDHCQADMKLDWKMTVFRFLASASLAWLVKHPLNKRGVLG